MRLRSYLFSLSFSTLSDLKFLQAMKEAVIAPPMPTKIEFVAEKLIATASKSMTTNPPTIAKGYAKQPNRGGVVSQNSIE